ncbi:adenosylhomocysteinase [Amycolatopsis saalfeldensis]|uniref:Adenosylhomocysteinase n=1 Tax=Amycolatopsis saalfeldensis TaxID=394193 RepID=A0A1H8RPR7_9PSEU|nr:adenosylhomocysteinase [Amycolatopsis saalfeldensis]SEO68287.1 adenosylhomocysteinase [Amycolatopsis saalfeldensis]
MPENPALPENPVLPGSPATAWALKHMPLTAQAVGELAPILTGRRLAMCLHVEPKTAGLVTLLVRAGVEVSLTGSPGTTHDDVADYLRELGVAVFTRRADGEPEHRRNVERVLECEPHLTLDNGGDLTLSLFESGAPAGYLGGTEETTTGGIRLRAASEQASQLAPVVVINDSRLKLLVENEFGVGQSVVQGFLNATNLMVPGLRAAVLGYGPCGKGVADTLSRLGARVSVCDTDPMRALEAILNGHRVGTAAEVVSDARLVFTATGHANVLGAEELAALPDGAVLAGVGHFAWEVDRTALAARTVRTVEYGSPSRRTGHVLDDGRELVLLDQGRMLNLTAANGNSIQAMDLGLTLQARCLGAVASGVLAPVVQSVPATVEHRIATDLVALLK